MSLRRQSINEFLSWNDPVDLNLQSAGERVLGKVSGKISQVIIKTNHLKRVRYKLLLSSEVIRSISFTVTTTGSFLHDAIAGSQYVY